jgi:hypothetical protein
MIATRIRSTLLISLILMATCAFAGSGGKNATLAGKWQFSWEARIGTERGTLQLEQADSKLTGSYRGNLVAQKVSGALDGDKIVLNFDFQRSHPFTIIFTGTVDGDKMTGKFHIKDFPDAYDSQGENVRPSNYSWTAVRMANQPASVASQGASPENKSAN